MTNIQEKITQLFKELRKNNKHIYIAELRKNTENETAIIVAAHKLKKKKEHFLVCPKGKFLFVGVKAYQRVYTTLSEKELLELLKEYEGVKLYEFPVFSIAHRGTGIYSCFLDVSEFNNPTK